MDDEKSVALLKEYREWCLSHRSSEYKISFYKDKYEHISVSTDYAEGTVAFYPLENFNIVEMSVVNKITTDAVFYLHFELKDMNHAKGLFEEMVSVVLKQKTSTVTKVLLCCSSGITTHYFLEKLKSASNLLNLDFEFSAVSYNNLYVKGYDNDVILLAPQIGFDYVFQFCKILFAHPVAYHLCHLTFVPDGRVSVFTSKSGCFIFFDFRQIETVSEKSC